MSKYSQFSDDSAISSFTDITPILMLNIGSQLKISNEYSIHMPNYMQNIFTNKFDKLFATTQLVEDINSHIQALKHKSCILSRDNNTYRFKTVRFSESTIHITKPEQQNIYPSSNELYTYEKSDNYSEDYINFVVEVSNTDLEINSDIIEDKKSDIIIEKTTVKKYNIICNCFSFIFE